MDTSQLIDNRIAELGGWRGKLLARLRKLIRNVAPELVEEWKWDTPVWSSNGNVLAVGAFHDHLKINFFHGALLEDHSLFNAGLDAQKTRAIDIFENDNVNETALKNLIRAAVDLNNTKSKPARPAAPQKQTTNAHNDLPKLAAPAQRALAAAGIQTLQQLTKFHEADIKELHGIGPDALKDLNKALKASGLSFKK